MTWFERSARSYLPDHVAAIRIQAMYRGHGLPLVHFSTQPEPLLVSELSCVQFVTSDDPSIVLHGTAITHHIPKKMFRLS
jgi:hypothetical protein